MTKQKILVVDDNDYITKTLKIFIESAGYDVQTKLSGIEALNYLKKNQVDLIIADINMPELDGFGMIQQLKENDKTSNIPIIVLTTDSANKEKAREIGTAGYLNKPFSSKRLLASIDKILG
jgi:two-component system chemotaxis response regulator CheY